MSLGLRGRFGLFSLPLPRTPHYSSRSWVLGPPIQALRGVRGVPPQNAVGAKSSLKPHLFQEAFSDAELKTLPLLPPLTQPGGLLCRGWGGLGWGGVPGVQEEKDLGFISPHRPFIHSFIQLPYFQACSGARMGVGWGDTWASSPAQTRLQTRV